VVLRKSVAEMEKHLAVLRKRLVEDDRTSIVDPSYDGSSIAGTDYNYTLKGFMLESESIIRGSPASSPESRAVAEPQVVPVSLQLCLLDRPSCSPWRGPTLWRTQV
jgi:hypothetical protein